MIFKEQAHFTIWPSSPGAPDIFNLGGPRQILKALSSVVDCNLVFALTAAENAMIPVFDNT